MTPTGAGATTRGHAELAEDVDGLKRDVASIKSSLSAQGASLGGELEGIKREMRRVFEMFSAAVVAGVGGNGGGSGGSVPSSPQQFVSG